eukprot:139957-Amphidinium_carterae.5
MDLIGLPRNHNKPKGTQTASECVSFGKDQKDVLLTKSQQELMHTINMKLLWCARQARPEVLNYDLHRKHKSRGIDTDTLEGSGQDGQTSQANR